MCTQPILYDEPVTRRISLVPHAAQVTLRQYILKLTSLNMQNCRPKIPDWTLTL